MVVKVEGWIRRAAAAPWTGGHPSITIDELSVRGMGPGCYDWRQVKVPETGVEVFYKHWCQSDIVDVIAVAGR